MKTTWSASGRRWIRRPCAGYLSWTRAYRSQESHSWTGDRQWMERGKELCQCYKGSRGWAQGDDPARTQGGRHGTPSCGGGAQHWTSTCAGSERSASQRTLSEGKHGLILGASHATSASVLESCASRTGIDESEEESLYLFPRHHARWRIRPPCRSRTSASGGRARARSLASPG